MLVWVNTMENCLSNLTKLSQTVRNFIKKFNRSICKIPVDLVTVRNSQERGWLEGTLNGKTGLIPANYVEMLPWQSGASLVKLSSSIRHGLSKALHLHSDPELTRLDPKLKVHRQSLDGVTQTLPRQLSIERKSSTWNYLKIG